MSKRIVRKVAVLGSGVMGSRIACHFAGVGIPVLLLDIVPPDQEGSDPLKAAAARNRIVNEALAAAVKSNPSPLYTKEALQLISTGNFVDNLADIKNCDWIIEVVVERLDIKKQIFDQVEKFRKPGTLVSSNTSGIPIHLMADGRSPDFQKHFCGTHFFNPPRYLRLLEIIPTKMTDPEVISFLTRFGDQQLGKTTVICKDTPAFIANRVGVYSIMLVFSLMRKLGLNIDEVDFLTGPLIGHPKSATFRTADIVGIDTLVNVAKGLYANCPTDESRELYAVPDWLGKMVASKWLGDKTGQGFFKKTRSASGEKEILTLDLDTWEYKTRTKTKFPTIEAAKPIDDLRSRLKMLLQGGDKAGEFYRAFHHGLLAYISNRVPEISDDLYAIDDAMQAGFGWDLGPFEIWDALGVADTATAMKKAGSPAAPWVYEMLGKGFSNFYQITGGKRMYYNVSTGAYSSLPGDQAFLVMRNFEDQTVWKNSACRLYHLGDEVLGLEWYTKMGSIGGEVLEGIQRSLTIAEEKYKGLVIANEGQNFSAGANVGMIFMLAVEQDFDELDMAVRLFQQTAMKIRYSAVPIVLAPHGLTLGGACELALHSDKVCAAAETYIGLVEVGVGLIPAGGGSKEFVLRANAEMHPDEPETITLKNRFIHMATARVATSAAEAFELGFFREGLDEVVLNPSRRITEAKRAVIDFSEAGYQPPAAANQIKVLGRSALGVLYAGVNGMLKAGYASEHDALIARKLAFVVCGGDLSEPSTVTEQYLLDLEREVFLSLCGEKKTLERLQSVLKTGKPIRN